MANFIVQHWHVLLTIRAGDEEQQQVIEYLQAENRVLNEKLDKKRIILNED